MSVLETVMNKVKKYFMSIKRHNELKRISERNASELKVVNLNILQLNEV